MVLQPMVKVLSAMEHKADYHSCKIECHQDEKDKPFPVSEKALVERGVKKPYPPYPGWPLVTAICNPPLNGPVTGLHVDATLTLISLHFHWLDWLEGGRCLSPLTKQLSGMSLTAIWQNSTLSKYAKKLFLAHGQTTVWDWGVPNLPSLPLGFGHSTATDPPCLPLLV